LSPNNSAAGAAYLATSSEDNTAKLWAVPELENKIHAASHRPGRELRRLLAAVAVVNLAVVAHYLHDCAADADDVYDDLKTHDLDVDAGVTPREPEERTCEAAPEHVRRMRSPRLDTADDNDSRGDDDDDDGVPTEEPGAKAHYAPDHLAMGPLEQYHQDDLQGMIKLAQIPEPRPTILLVTTADVELDAVLHRLEPLDEHAAPGRFAVRGVLVILGKLGGRRVYVVQTKQSELATFVVVSQLLADAELKGLKLVFPVGIAWGSDPARADKPRERQMIGDVLVADQCINAERVKVQNGRTELRGPITDSPLANTITYSLCREWPTNRRAWRAVSGRPRLPRTHIGTIVSLATLYNDAGAASSWREHAQTKPHKVIGGDIELFQVVRAAEKHGVKWLFAKGISDYGGIKPKTDDGQPLAAANAVDFADWLLRESVMTAFVDNYNTP